MDWNFWNFSLYYEIQLKLHKMYFNYYFLNKIDQVRYFYLKVLIISTAKSVKITQFKSALQFLT